MSLQEGWYLMSVSDLERELARSRGERASSSNAIRLSVDRALQYRDAGNLPDEKGRTLRLVLCIEKLEQLDSKRRAYEPDYLEAPQWRRAGSAPVNIVPLRDPERVPGRPQPWFEDPKLAALEDEWIATGSVAGLRVPSEYRGFVYKTILALQAAGKHVAPESVADSIARWVPPEEAATIRRALIEPTAGPLARRPQGVALERVADELSR